MWFFSWLGSYVPQPDIARHVRVEDGEMIEDLVPHHPIVYVLPVLEGLLAIGLLTWSAFLSPDVAWLWMLAGGAVGAHAGWQALGEHMDRFVVTNQRVFRVSGVLGQKRATMPIQRILDITVEKPFFGRLLGYGHLVFESAAQEQGLRDIRFVAYPDERDKTIQGVVQRSGLRGPRAMH